MTRCPADERGTGLVSTLTGVSMFLVFLLFAVQLCLFLFASSTVGALTADAAMLVAHGSAGPAGAEARARELLGASGGRARFDWSGSTAEFVVLRVTAPAPRILAAVPGLDEIDRTVRVRRELVAA